MSGAEMESFQHAAEQSEVAQETAEHATGPASAGDSILHHVLDSNELEVPFFPDSSIPLPEIHLWGVDLSITKHVVMMWLASLILLFVFWVAARRAKDPTPTGIRNLLEILMQYIRDEVARRAIGPQGDRYVGYLLSTFFFIMACNLLGLVPGMATATGNVSVTAALALVAFLMIQQGGIREHGIIGHFKNFAPPGIPVWLVPLMVFVEFLGMLIKPFALCIRLFANMMAGHVVILSFISLIFILNDFWGLMGGLVTAPFAVLLALFVHLLEIFIACLQAYIFTMLTATFIGMSIHPAH